VGLLTLDRRIKPAAWDFDPGRVDPAWRGLCRGLVAVVPMTERTGPAGIVYPARVPLPLNTGTTWGADHLGSYIQADAVDEGLHAVAPAFLKINYPLTFAVYGEALALPTNGSWIMAVTTDGTSVSYGVRWWNEIEILVNSGGTPLAIGVGYSTWSTARMLRTVIIRSGVLRYYENDIQRGGSAAAISNPPYSASSELTFGTLPTAADHDPDFRYRAGWVWNRALSPAEIAQLALDPFGMFRPARRVVGRAPAGGSVELVVQDLAIGLAVDSPALTQAHQLAVQDLSLALAIESAALTQAHVLAVQDATLGLTLESVALTQAHVLALQELALALAIDAPTLTQAHVLAVADVAVALALEQPTLSLSTLLEVAEVAVALALESPALTQAQTLAVQDAFVALGLESPALVQTHVLAVHDVVVALVLDGVVLVLPDDFALALLTGFTLTGPRLAGVTVRGPRLAGVARTIPRLTTLTLE